MTPTALAALATFFTLVILAFISLLVYQIMSSISSWNECDNDISNASKRYQSNNNCIRLSAGASLESLNHKIVDSLDHVHFDRSKSIDHYFSSSISNQSNNQLETKNQPHEFVDINLNVQ